MYPPALAKNGEIRLGKKVDLLSCLKNITAACEGMPEISAEVLDGAVILNITKVTCGNTFMDYADKQIVFNIQHEVSRYERADVIFDTYKKDNLKSTTRLRRGKRYQKKSRG